LFQTKQREARTRSQLVRYELGETLDHAMRAAGHAADGFRAAGVQMMPAASRFRGAASQRWEDTVAAFNAPTRTMARRPTARATTVIGRREMRRRQLRRRRMRGRGRWSRFFGLVAAGAAVGGATALVLRRRRQQWEEYREQALESVGAETGAGPAESGMTAAERMAAGPGAAEEGLYEAGAAGTERVDELMDRATGEGRR
jgi:hypothetical protein